MSSADRTFKTMVAPQLVLGNASFERQTGGAPDLYPWTKYTYTQLDTPIDGIIGHIPAVAPLSGRLGSRPTQSASRLMTVPVSWVGTRRTYQNGGVYQRIIVPSPGTYAFCARFATYQSEPIGYPYTMVNIGIDPAGGTDPNASTVKWWRGASSTNDNLWLPGGVLAECPRVW